VNASPYLAIPEGMTISGGIGDFHVKGHVNECFARFSLLFIEGVGVVDGEILETLWSVLNETSRSAKGSTLAHRNEILDDHMNHSNWKKLIGMGRYIYVTAHTF
jgi:Kyakuja-Dileera-Zisupton transposase